MPIEPKIRHTTADCSLNGARIALVDWSKLSSDELAQVVGVQEPGGTAEHPQDYDWEFTTLATDELRLATEDGDEPEGGWREAYLRHTAADAEAVSLGSPEYAGREQWLRTWCEDTRIYPLYLVDEGGYRLWDGYHRLAGAFYLGAERVAVVLGRPKLRPK